MHFIRIFGYVSKKLLFTLFPDSKILLPPTLWYMPWDMWRWYGDAFNDFADCCDKFLTQAHTGEPYDGDNMPKGTVHPVYIPISLAIGFLISLLIGRSKSAKLKSVRKKEATEEHPESSDGWKQSTANMKKEKDESYIFSRFVFFVRADRGNDFSDTL